MVAKANTPSEVQAMCTVRGHQGLWRELLQDATGSRWQVLSVQRRDPNDKSKTTAATDRHAESLDESTWFWLTSKQIGFSFRPTGGGEHEERAQELDSTQRVRDHLVAYHLAPAISDFISGENRECYNNEFEQTLTLLPVNGVQRSSPRGKAQHIIHSLSATQLTRKFRSSCAEACGRKHP